MEYANRRRKTRREAFLEHRDKIIPWADWVTLIATHYPSGRRGARLLASRRCGACILCKNWFNLSDEGIEDAIYDSHAMRAFLRIDFLQQQVPGRNNPAALPLPSGEA
ncbi:MAG: transposase [Pyramidobacter sp.]|nr:transposase [Pyramidobacter sp.]